MAKTMNVIIYLLAVKFKRQTNFRIYRLHKLCFFLEEAIITTKIIITNYQDYHH